MFSSLRALPSRAAVSAAWAVTALVAPATAQETNIWTTATVAGGNVNDGGPATSGRLYSPWGVAVDAAGNLYIADRENDRIRKVDASTGNISTVAGTETGGYRASDDGAAATAAQLRYPYRVAADGSGNLYIADTWNNRIRKVDAATGIITTIAGGGSALGDGGPATSAQLDFPHGVAMDASGNLYIADWNNHRIRKVDAAGNISTVAGTGTVPGDYSGDGGAATAAQLDQPSDVAVDASGNLYIADSDNNRVRKVDAATGIITTVAGTGTGGFSGDGGPATSAQIRYPGSVALDASGNLYIAANHRIRKVDTAGVITTVAGTGTQGYSGDGGAATSAQIRYPSSVALDASGNLYIADGNHRIRKVDASTGNISTVAGTGVQGFSGDNGPATSAQFNWPSGVAVDASGNLYIADGNNRIRKVDAATGIITTVAGTGTGGFSGDGGPATSAQLHYPRSVALDASGNLYIADWLNNRVRKVDAESGTISTIAVRTVTPTWLFVPLGVAVDGAGNVYIADTRNNRVLRAAALPPLPSNPQAPGRVIEDVGGDGTPGGDGDGGPAANARVNSPSGVAIDGAGNVYIADTRNNRVRRIDPDGIIDEFAGDGTAGFGGDGGAAVDAQLKGPNGAAVDRSGNVYIADTRNHRIRKVDAAGNISTIAGTGAAGFGGDGGAAAAAQLNNPYGVAADGGGNIYIADTGNHRIRKIDADGNISTVAGTGTAGYSGDGGAAAAAQLNSPYGVAADAAGNVYIADSGNDRIRRVDRAGQITTFAGGGASGGTPLSYRGGFAGGAAASAQGGRRGIRATAILLERPSGVALDGAGNVYIADSGNNRILRVGRLGEVTAEAESSGSAGGDRLDNPWGLAADRSGGVYFTDRGNHRVRSLRLREPAGTGRPQPEFGPAVRARTSALSFVMEEDAAASPQTVVLYAEDEAAEFELRPSARWLSVSPARGRLAAGAETTITVTVDPTGLRLGAHSGRLYVRAGGRVSAQVRVTLEVRPGSGPAVSENGGVVNAARMSAYGEPGLFGPQLLPLAPGSIVEIRGRNFTEGESFMAEGFPLPTMLGGARVRIDGRAAPLFSARPERITAQWPSGVPAEGAASSFASVVVEAADGASSYPRLFHAAAYAPGVFTAAGTGAGQGSVVFAGTSDLAAPRGYSGGSRPARAGDIVEIYATGLGALEPPLADGEAADGDVLRRAVAPVRVWIGGWPLAPEDAPFAGAAPGLVGVNVILARVPPGLAPSDASEVRIAVGGAESQPGVTIAVE